MQPTRMSFGINREAQFTGPESARWSPLSGMQSQQQPKPPLRRLSDAVEEAFRFALTRGDLATAEDLLGVLRALHERDRIKYPERRNADATLALAEQELVAKRASRQRRF